MKNMMVFTVFMAFLVNVPAGAGESSPFGFLRRPAVPPGVVPGVQRVTLKGEIAEEELAFNLDIEAITVTKGEETAVLAGEAILVESKAEMPALRFETASTGARYLAAWPRPGAQRTALRFKARGHMGEGGWIESTLELPEAPWREIEIVAPDAQAEIELPGAFRVEKGVREGRAFVSGLIASGVPLQVRWRFRRGAAEDAPLLYSSVSRTLVRVSAGELGCDARFAYEISQGRLERLEWIVPGDFAATAVEGEGIRSWQLERDAVGQQRLAVVLSRPQTGRYALRVAGGRPVKALPGEEQAPLLEPVGPVRSEGWLAVFTDQALLFTAADVQGLVQVGSDVFPWEGLTRGAQPLQGRLLCYRHQGTGARARFSLRPLFPAVEARATGRALLSEENLKISWEFDLDVREAALERLVLLVPKGFSASRLSGTGLAEDAWTLRAPAAANASFQELEAVFHPPLMGHGTVKIEVENGSSPLLAPSEVRPVLVQNARSLRGTLALEAGQGLEVPVPGAKNLREVPAASLPEQQAKALYAYRFRDGEWSLTLAPKLKPAGLRAEALQLVALSEERLYGMAALNYDISGAPQDELRFDLPAGVEQLEFTGEHVSRHEVSGRRVTVHLARKILGPYHLAVSYSTPYTPGAPFAAGAVDPVGVALQSGFIAITSRLDLEIEPAAQTGVPVFPIRREEIPEAYRLLIAAPILAAYEYSGTPHEVRAMVRGRSAAVFPAAMAEFASLESRIELGREGGVEVLTRARYRIKNALAQYFSLVLPKNARLWSAHRGGEDAKMKTAIVPLLDGAALKLPLERRRDADDPLVLEIEYSEQFPAGGWLGRADLRAPELGAPATFTEWRVVPTEDFSLAATGGSMSPQVQTSGTAHFREQLLGAWGRALTNFSTATGLGILLVMAGAALLAVLWLGARWVPVLGVLALAGFIALGISASWQLPPAASGEDAARDLVFRQAASSAPPTLALRLAPALFRGCDPLRAAMALGAALLTLLLAWRDQRRRGIWTGATLGMVLAAGSMAEGMHVALLHFCTWGLPVLMGATRFAPRAASLRAGLRAAAPAALLLAVLPWGGNLAASEVEIAPGGATTPESLPSERLCRMGLELPRVIPAPAPLESVRCSLRVGEDHAEITLSLDAGAKPPAVVPLLFRPAIPRATPMAKGWTLRERGGRYVLESGSRAAREVAITFLVPLPEEGPTGLRTLAAELPPALVKTLSLDMGGHDLEITVTGAVSLSQREEGARTLAQASLLPGAGLDLLWHPRERRASQEAPAFFAEVMSLYRLEGGGARSVHAVRLRVARGEVDRARVELPEGFSPAGVGGAAISWRYDPASRAAEILFAKPVSGEVSFLLSAHTGALKTPYELDLKAVGITGAEGWKGAVAVAAADEILLGLATKAPESTGPVALDPGDFARRVGNGALTSLGVGGGEVRYAFSLLRPVEFARLRAEEARAELRSRETSVLSAGDERLLYGAELEIEISRCGVFFLDLILPQGFDLDQLQSPAISRYDELAEEGGSRRVRLHFPARREGTFALKAALSRPLPEGGGGFAITGLRPLGTLRHSGRLIAAPERGLRLSARERGGLSDASAEEWGARADGTLAFRILKEDWRLELGIEALEARLAGEVLHCARIGEGRTVHEQRLRVRSVGAGFKSLVLRLPPGATGVSAEGAEISRQGEAGQGLYHVELARRWIASPYSLTLRYETPMDPESGLVTLRIPELQGAQSWSATLAVFAQGRMELRTAAPAGAFEPADARAAAGEFPASDLHSAALCYTVHVPGRELVLRVLRHTDAPQPGAEVLGVELDTVVSEQGSRLHRLKLRLRAGDRRHLLLSLPASGELLDLRTAGLPANAALNSAGNALTRDYLVPLEALRGAAEGEIEAAWRENDPGFWEKSPQSIPAPGLDLPLRNVSWRLYLPETRRCRAFAGSLVPVAATLEMENIIRFNGETLNTELIRDREQRLKRAMVLQRDGVELARAGRGDEARRALEQACFESAADEGLGEDARVQLRELLKDQAMAGLKGASDRLRASAGADPGAPGRDGSAGLERIGSRFMELQQAAATTPARFRFALPRRGRLVEFRRELKAEPDAPLEIRFASSPVFSGGWRDPLSFALTALLLAAACALVFPARAVS